MKKKILPILTFISVMIFFVDYFFYEKPKKNIILLSETGYQFTQNWVDPNAPNWKKVLKEYIGKPNIRALEIGSFEGFSAIWFLKNILTHSTSTITCIDIFIEKDYEDRFDHNILLSGETNRVLKIKANSQIILRSLELNSYDFIYIDGDHRAQAVLIDAILSWDLLKPGGYLIFDDYEWRKDGKPDDIPRTAIDTFISYFKNNIRLITTGWQLIIKKESPFVAPTDYKEGNRQTKLLNIPLNKL